MNIILKYFLIISIVGAVGNFIALRNKDILSKRKWWLKYFTYVIWAGAVISGILFIKEFYFWMSCVVCSIGIYEIVKNFQSFSSNKFQILISAILIFIFYLLFSKSFDKNLYLSFFIVICLFDAFCQITGQIFGTKKIIKSISPQKTLEGYIGGTLVTILFVFLVLKNIYTLDKPWTQIIFFMTIGAACGDFLSSMLKRFLKIKDFSELFPGQGGFLDRYDSHIFAGAAYFCYNFIS